MPALDHGFVRVVDYMGDDTSIVQSARVSYGKGTKQVSTDKEFYLPSPENLAAQSSSNRQGRGDIIEGEQAKEVLELLKNDAERTYDSF